MAKVFDAKALVEQAEGRRARFVPAYHFGNRVTKVEREDHNPFKDIELDEPSQPEE